MLVAALVALGAGVAYGAHQNVVAGDDFFSPPQSFTNDQGEVGTFQNNGLNQHNVTADATGPDGKALFRSNTINGGTTPIQGTQYLSAGQYPFSCTIHPSMHGTLVVTGNGSPQPRPSATLKITTKTIAVALRSGITVQADNTQKVDAVDLKVTLGKSTIGTATNLAQAQGRIFEVVRLTKAGKAKLKGKQKATVKVSEQLPFGTVAPATRKLK